MTNQHNSPNTRFKTSRSTNGRLLCVMALIAAALVLGESWLTLVVFAFAVIFMASEILVSYLPDPLANAMNRNCIRQNGTWSQKREKSERRAINKLRWDIRLVMLLVLLPTIFLTYMIDSEVVPLRLGFSGLLSLRATESESRANLFDEEKGFDKWAQSTSHSLDPEIHKRALWRFWPIVIVLVLAWIAGCWLTIKMTFLRQLKELAAGIHRRGSAYIQHDRAHGML